MPGKEKNIEGDQGNRKNPITCGAEDKGEYADGAAGRSKYLPKNLLRVDLKLADLLRAVDDVMIRQNRAIGLHDDARTKRCQYPRPHALGAVNIPPKKSRNAGSSKKVCCCGARTRRSARMVTTPGPTRSTASAWDACEAAGARASALAALGGGTGVGGCLGASSFLQFANATKTSINGNMCFIWFSRKRLAIGC
jgi:hypothetical protein